MSAKLAQPPAYVEGEFLDEPDAPADYIGPEFNFETVAELISDGGDGTILVLNTSLAADNIQLKPPKNDPSHPIYFDFEGHVHSYVISIWRDRFVIEVWDLKPIKRVDAWFPRTEGELRQRLAELIADCK